MCTFIHRKTLKIQRTISTAATIRFMKVEGGEANQCVYSDAMKASITIIYLMFLLYKWSYSEVKGFL